MGSASSKAARRLPRATGLCVPTSATAEPAHPLPSEKPLAFESKDKAIERDAKDPDLVQKLKRLGPVHVNHPMQTVRVARDVQNMHRSRMRSEAEAARLEPTKNRLLASSLVELLETRKSVTDRAELEVLAMRYHMDVAKLEQLSRVVNTPSIDKSMVVRTTDNHGEESLTMTAQWIDPILSRA